MIARAVCPVLIGREEELSVLEDALLAAARGEGSVVVLAGDAGMGKSRLCAELVRRADKIGAAVMEGSCPEAELVLPYLPFLEAIGNHLETANVTALAERLGVHARQLASLFPQLPADPTGTTSESPDARLRLFEAILALLRIAAEEGGLLLVLEDLHWADASTRELLDYLTRRLRNTRMLVLATYRRDEMTRRHPLLPIVQAWQRSRLAQVVELEALAPEGVGRMVSAIFDDTDVGSEFRDFIHQRSEGNPFVLEEMLKDALDRGDIFRDGGDWQRKPLQELRIPETVRDTILLRLERLDAEQAGILQCAAVLGRSFDYATLLEVAGRERPVVEAALQAASLQQLLEEDRSAAGRYRFRHALTREAIYDDLSAPMRERLHAAAAEALRERPGATAELAYHLRAAHRWDEAVPATLQAAAEAETRFGYVDAAELYELLLPVVTSGVERGRILCRLGEALWRATRLRGAIDPLREGVRLLEGAGETTPAAGYRLVLGRCLWESGLTVEAEHEYERARAQLETEGASRELALAYIRLAGLANFDFRTRLAKELAEKAIAVAGAAGASDMRIWALNHLGLATAHLGDHEAGIRLLEQSAHEAEAAELPEIAGNALHNLIPTYLTNLQATKLPELAKRLERLPVERWGRFSSLDARGTWALLSGRVGEAVEIGRELGSRSDEVGAGFYRDTADLFVCLGLVEMDRAEEARRYEAPSREGLNAQSLAGDTWARMSVELAAGNIQAALPDAELSLKLAEEVAPYGANLAVAGQVFVSAGRLDEAQRLADIMQSTAFRLTRTAGQVLNGVVAAARGGSDAALALVREAAGRLADGGFFMEAARARLVIADLLSAAGDRDAALAELEDLLVRIRGRELRLLERQLGERLVALGSSPPLPEETPAPAAVEVPSEIGERYVTVMFADVRGYTSMTGQTAPAEMLDRISTYQRWAAQEVERQLGTVDKFAGDAVMATFNVSGAQVDHAAHALKAAQALRDKAALLGLPVGIGLATGAAVVGRLKDGANLSVLGATTNLAARVQAQARAGEILLSEETRKRLPDVPAEAEQLELKGFDALVPAYRVRA